MEVFRRDPDVMESLVSQLNIISIQNSATRIAQALLNFWRLLFNNPSMCTFYSALRIAIASRQQDVQPAGHCAAPV